MFKLSDYFNVLCEEAGPDKSGSGGKVYTEEELEAIVAERTAGLKANSEKLLAEKKEAKRLADEAAAAKLLADQDAAKKSGELEAFEKTLRSQYDGELAAKDKALQARSERILTSEKKAIVSSLSGMLIDESATELLGMLVRAEFDGDDVATKFVGADGAVITTDVEQFKKYLCEHKAFSHLIKADAATGGGANGGKFRGGATKTANELTGEERAALLREDPNEFYRLFPGLRKK